MTAPRFIRCRPREDGGSARCVDVSRVVGGRADAVRQGQADDRRLAWHADVLRGERAASKRRSRQLAPGLLYLPPYSPGLNSIEQFFAKLKALLRKAAAR